MKSITLLKLLIVAGGMLMTLVGCVCDEPGTASAEKSRMALLKIKVALTSQDYLLSRAVGDEYEPDKASANNAEKMHTVRILILDSKGNAEHNTLWDLSKAPDVVATGQNFPVKANDTKTVILLANEVGTVLVDPSTDSSVDAADYFAAIDAQVGEYVDVDKLSKLLMKTGDNPALFSLDGTTTPGTPLPMSAIHCYKIGDGVQYNATFNIHRAAVKYTYRITNSAASDQKFTINSVAVNHVAQRQYLFPDADFLPDYTDANGTNTQMFWSAYRTPDEIGEALTLPVNRTVLPGEKFELASFYLPEGHSVSTDSPYRTGITVDGTFLGWRNLEWYIPQLPEEKQVMTDLPRNTHVVVNITVTSCEFDVHYTLCPWSESEIDIPSFN